MSRLTRYICIPAALAVAFGCASAARKSSFTRVEPDLRDRWITSYARARAGAPDACAIYRGLSTEPGFPLVPLTDLRAAEACHDPATHVDRAALPPYLRDLALDVMLTLARERHDLAGEMDAAAEIARRKMPQVERITWLKLALARATELKDAKRVAELNARLYDVAPRLNPAPRPAQYLAVAADFRQARDFTNARAYYEKVYAGAGPPEDKIAALKGLRTAAKNSRRNDEHLRAARRLNAYLTRTRAARSKSPKVRNAAYEALIFEARAVWTEGHRDQAQKLIARVELEQRGKRSLAEVYWLRARLADEAKDFGEVARYLDLAVNEKPTGAWRDKIFWNAAWNDRQRGQLDQAAQRLRELEGGTTDDTVRPRAIYWLGQTLLDQTKTDEANEAFARVIELDPVGYYGLLAHRRLNRPLALKFRPDGAREVAPTMDPTLTDWLNAFGETELLAGVVDEAATAYARTRGQTDGAWLDLLQTYARAGLYLKLFSGLGTLAPELRRRVLDGHPELLFPRPWPDLVTAAATKSGIDPALIYSIMRQESAFDPKARSFADAYGLMQLIPEVAKRTAPKIGVPFTRGEDMFDPAVSIPLGAAFLSELSARYKGKLILLSAGLQRQR